MGAEGAGGEDLGCLTHFGGGCGFVGFGLALVEWVGEKSG